MHSDDDDNGPEGGEIVLEIPIERPHRISARAVNATLDTVSEARAEARTRALEAVEQLVEVMRHPGRNAMSQLLAAKHILELAGLGSQTEIALERLVAAVKATLPPHDAARVLRALYGADRRSLNS